MSVLAPRPLIVSGDRVVLYGGKSLLEVITVKEDGYFNCKHGHFAHNHLIGKPFGTRIRSASGTNKDIGHVTAMQPTAELWTSVVRFRTQILYTVDNSMILMELEIRPGYRVVESGTGSGALSTYFIRTIAPMGHLYTYEFHKQRAEAAKKDFEENGLDRWVTVTQRDVLEEGFLGVEGVAPAVIDAVFLDLPAPWKALESAKTVLAETGKICSFSPCIEQVQRTAATLDTLGFEEIVTIEVLERPYQSFIKKVEVIDFEAAPPLQLHEQPASVEQQPKRRKGELAVTKSVELQAGLKPRADIRGHTGWLTFARKPVAE